MGKISNLIYLTVFLLSFTSCFNKQPRQIIEQDTVNKDKFYSWDFESKISNYQSNSNETCLNDFAENISFITLDEDQLLIDLNFLYTKNHDSFIVSSGYSNTATSIMRFDLTGKFIENIINLGHGPGEVSGYFQWHTDILSEKLTVSPGYKIVQYSFKDKETNDIILDKYYPKIFPLKDENYVALNSFYSLDNKSPYLTFIDKEGNTEKNIYYTDDRDIYFQLKEGGGTGLLDSYEFFQSYNGDVLFYDIFNDTIFRIEEINSIKPYIVLKRGNLAPENKDMNIPERSNKKLFIRKVNETDKYIFVRYFYRGRNYSTVWDKSTGELIVSADAAHAEISHLIRFSSFFIPYRTPSGKNILVGIIKTMENQLYCAVNPKDACEFLDNVNEDSNPVIMIVDLK